MHSHDLVHGYCFFGLSSVSGDRIEMLVGRTELHQVLAGEKVNIDPSLMRRAIIDREDTIELTIYAKGKRIGGEVHLLLPPDSATPVRHPRPALIKLSCAVARGTRRSCMGSC